MTTKQRTIPAAVALITISGLAHAQSVELLPALNGQSMAQDINNSGVAVGQSINALGHAVAVMWDASGTPTQLGSLDGETISWAEAINASGVVVGYCEDGTGLRRATLWAPGESPFNLHNAMGSNGPSIPWDINDDGLVVGQAPINPGFAKGFAWDHDAGALVSGIPSFYQGSAFYGTNNVGDLVGSGFFFGDPDDAMYFRADDRGGYEEVGINPFGFYFSQARAINGSGMIIGHSGYNSTTAGWNACIFTGDDRDPVQTLGSLEGYDTSEGLDVNNDGMVVGYAWDGTFSGIPPHAFAWVDGTMYDLNDYLATTTNRAGAPFDVLLRATGVNDNGDIVGFGALKNGDLASFVIRGFDPGSTCPADFNGDGSLDFFDLSAFLEALGNEDPAADFSGDGQYDFFDVSAFLDAYGEGCP